MSSAPKLARSTSFAEITAFLEQRRFAAIGVSRDPKDFTRSLTREFVKRGYEVVPVNPAASEMDGHQCFAAMSEVTPPVTAALVLTPAKASFEVARQCVASGVTHIWFHRAGGEGAVDPEAVKFCREHGLTVVAGECPFMFLSGAGLPHRVHGIIRKVFGGYPR